MRRMPSPRRSVLARDRASSLKANWNPPQPSPATSLAAARIGPAVCFAPGLICFTRTPLLYRKENVYEQ
jgi:hypothetical protein